MTDAGRCGALHRPRHETHCPSPHGGARGRWIRGCACAEPHDARRGGRLQPVRLLRKPQERAGALARWRAGPCFSTQPAKDKLSTSLEFDRRTRGRVKDPGRSLIRRSCWRGVPHAPARCRERAQTAAVSRGTSRIEKQASRRLAVGGRRSSKSRRRVPSPGRRPPPPRATFRCRTHPCVMAFWMGFESCTGACPRAAPWSTFAPWFARQRPEFWKTGQGSSGSPRKKHRASPPSA